MFQLLVKWAFVQRMLYQLTCIAKGSFKQRPSPMNNSACYSPEHVMSAFSDRECSRRDTPSSGTKVLPKSAGSILSEPNCGSAHSENPMPRPLCHAHSTTPTIPRPLCHTHRVTSTLLRPLGHIRCVKSTRHLACCGGSTRAKCITRSHPRALYRNRPNVPPIMKATDRVKYTKQ